MSGFGFVLFFFFFDRWRFGWFEFAVGPWVWLIGWLVFFFFFVLRAVLFSSSLFCFLFSGTLRVTTAIHPSIHFAFRISHYTLELLHAIFSFLSQGNWNIHTTHFITVSCTHIRVPPFFPLDIYIAVCFRSSYIVHNHHRCFFCFRLKINHGFEEGRA